VIQRQPIHAPAATARQVLVPVVHHLRLASAHPRSLRHCEPSIPFAGRMAPDGVSPSTLPQALRGGRGSVDDGFGCWRQPIHAPSGTASGADAATAVTITARQPIHAPSGTASNKGANKYPLATVRQPIHAPSGTARTQLLRFRTVLLGVSPSTLPQALRACRGDRRRPSPSRVSPSTLPQALRVPL